MGKLRNRRGFTLLEMTIVLFIISLLVLIIVPNLTAQRKHATTVNRDALVTVVQNQAELFHDDTGSNPASLAQLQRAKYLTARQVHQAQREGISISQGRVVD